MASIPSQRYNKPNWLILHNNHCLLAKNSNATTLLIGDSIIADLSRYPSAWNKYFGNNSVNFRIRGDRVQNVLWRSINLPILSSLSKIVILCGTNNIFNDSPYDIVDGIIKIASTFEKIYPNSSIDISGLLPRDESWSVKRVTIDEINKSLQYQCIREGFIYIDQSIGWTYKNGELDPVLFYKDSLHLVEKGNVKLAESFCSTRTSSTNVSVSPCNSSYANSVYFKIREKELPPLAAARFPYKNVTKFKSHYKSYNHSYSCSVSNGKLSCPVSLSNPVCTLGVKPSRIVSISKSICTVSISKSIRPVNVSKSTTPVNVSKSTSPVYISKTICPVIVSSSPVNVSKSSNPVNVPIRPRPVNISKPFCPVKISTCPARVSKCSRPVNVLTRPVNPIRSTYTERKKLCKFTSFICIFMRIFVFNVYYYE